MSVTANRALAGLAGRSLASTDDLSDAELAALLDLARLFKKKPYGEQLARKVLGMVFFNPSLRTRASFEAGMFQMGGHSIHLAIGQGVWKLEHREGVVMDGDATEHLKEAVPVLSRYCDMLAVRAFPIGRVWDVERTDPVIASFLKYATVPVINMESSMYHPCQGLADLLTLHEKLKQPKRKKFLLTWAYHPKPLPTAVPNSALLAASRAGMEIVLAHPPGYELDPDVMKRVRANSKRSGGSVSITHSRASAFKGVHAVYAKSWGSLKHYGNEADERQLRVKHMDWQVTPKDMKKTDGGIFMHCLPVRRNVVVADAVLDSPASVVVDEAENRLHVQKALLVAIGGAKKR
jgi:N-acetylornithine carbamoyltransferase